MLEEVVVGERNVGEHAGADREIVRAIIQLAKSLELKTIAEGVEDVATLEILRAYGCDEVQGYYYAKPMSVADLTTFLAR